MMRSIYCNVSLDMPPSARAYWNPYIDWAGKIITEVGAHEVILELHWHADTWQFGCGFLGMHNSNTMELHLCGNRAPSKITILHEIAHVIAPDGVGHDRTWAATLLQLNKSWLPARRALRANRAHAYSYRSFASVWRAHSGEALVFRGFPHHTDEKSRERSRFKHRFRRRAAIRALRNGGYWKDFWEQAATESTPRP